jgi:hypothetical protein
MEWWSAFLTAALLGGCAPSILDDCRTDADCATGVCDQGYCVPEPEVVGPCAGAEALGPLYAPDGTLCDTVRTVARWSPGAPASFDGVDASAAPLTVEAWVRVGTGAAETLVVARDAVWRFELAPAAAGGYAPRLHLAASDEIIAFPGATPVAADVATHVALVFEGSGPTPARTWVFTGDGTRTDAAAPVSLSATTTAGPLRFGGVSLLAARVLTGVLSPTDLAAAPAPLRPD